MNTYPYIEIACTLKYRILNGSYQPGQQLPSIRIIAAQEKCNTATAQHATISPILSKQTALTLPLGHSLYYLQGRRTIWHCLFR
ncbi:GntR family transcriptional regulator [Kineothrix sp. MB12-C1]|uniref:GntR family transcriptional regulator n=1 Tax=Kineothrix sp. MB12-C1 TaxID=3070215 RepID=UPI003FA5CB0F